MRVFGSGTHSQSRSLMCPNYCSIAGIQILSYVREVYRYSDYLSYAGVRILSYSMPIFGIRTSRYLRYAGTRIPVPLPSSHSLPDIFSCEKEKCSSNPFKHLFIFFQYHEGSFAGFLAIFFSMTLTVEGIVLDKYRTKLFFTIA